MLKVGKYAKNKPSIKTRFIFHFDGLKLFSNFDSLISDKLFGICDSFISYKVFLQRLTHFIDLKYSLEWIHSILRLNITN